MAPLTAFGPPRHKRHLRYSSHSRSLRPPRPARRVAGSSTIEAIVASIVFMVVFLLSLSALTRLTLRDDEGLLLLEAERAIDNRSTRLAIAPPPTGVTTEHFAWGSLTTTVAPYGEHTDIRLVVLSATLAGSRKTIELRHIVATPRE
jgi:hypothetical protein